MLRARLVVLSGAGRHLPDIAGVSDCPPSRFTSGLRVATPTGSAAYATNRVPGGDGGLSRRSGIGPSIWLPPPCLVGWPAPSPPPRRVGPLAATTHVSDERRSGVWPKRIVIVTASIGFSEGATTIRVDELGRVIPRTFSQRQAGRRRSAASTLPANSAASIAR